MLIKNYFELSDEHKQNILFQLEVGKELWGAIPFLLELLKNETFHKHLGNGELLLLLDEECFVEGFRMGVQIILDVLNCSRSRMEVRL